MAMKSLPLEIIDHIVNDLGDPDDQDSRPTLQAYALTSHWHSTRVQRALFATISLTNDTVFAKFAHLMDDSPHLLNYVRVLKARCVPETLYRLGSLSPTLTTLNLRSLTLIAPHFQSFYYLPTTLKLAFLEMFRSPTLVSLNVYWFSDLPLQYIISCTQLKRLDIKTRYIDSHIVEDDNDALIQPTATTCSLESLKVNCEQCAQGIVDSSSPQHPLQTIVANFIGYGTLSALISQSHQSLRTLEIIDCLVDDPNPAPLGIDFINLESLTLSFRYHYNGHKGGALIFLTSLLEHKSINTAVRPLKSIDLRFFGLTHRHFDLLESDVWNRLDTALSQPRYLTFDHVKVEIYTPSDDDIDYERRQQFHARLPSLNKAGKFVFEWYVVA
ncbi:hypothetical protein DXG01_004011 [Tephrocybe rancida]|nr:hypothetical protein DXG01_004011 [Tephrocybe rancida]